jgi:hypothetical protein
MVKCGVLFEVRTEFLNIIWTILGFKGLRILLYCHCTPNPYVFLKARTYVTTVAILPAEMFKSHSALKYLVLFGGTF